MYDQKHALCGWRTGRAYHALLAGIPVTAPRGNPALAWAWQTDSPMDLARFIKLPTEDRRALHAAQCAAAKADIEKAFRDLGL